MNDLVAVTIQMGNELRTKRENRQQNLIRIETHTYNLQKIRKRHFDRLE